MRPCFRTQGMFSLLNMPTRIVAQRPFCNTAVMRLSHQGSSPRSTNASQSLCRSRLKSRHFPNASHRQFQSSSHHPQQFWDSFQKKGEKIYTSEMAHNGSEMLNRFIFVRTLVNFYEEVLDGIILDCNYADSRPNEDYSPSVPVVVGLHDTPGTHHDMMAILNVLAKLGCRTIAPTFPGHGDTLGLVSGYDDMFSHSTTERAMFVHDFLRELGIERVDLLVSLGASSYPAMRLCAESSDTNIDYRCMALISPWPLQRPRYEPDPNQMRRAHRVCEHPLLRPSARMFLPSFQFEQNHTIRDKIATTYLLANLDMGEVGGLALATSTLNIPRAVLFGAMDSVVEEDLYLDLTDNLEIPRDNLVSFDGKHVTPSLPGGVVFPLGGYNLHRQYPGILSAYLLSIVQRFHPNIRI